MDAGRRAAVTDAQAAIVAVVVISLGVIALAGYQQWAHKRTLTPLLERLYRLETANAQMYAELQCRPALDVTAALPAQAPARPRHRVDRSATE